MLLTALLVVTALPPATLTFQDGVLTPPLVGSPAEAAVRFAASRRAELGVDPRSTLEAGRLMSTRFGGTVQLEQRVQGLPVHGARVVVTFDTQQRVVRVSSSLRPFEAVNAQYRLTAQDALAAASREVEGAWLRDDGVPYGGATKRAFVVNGQLHVGWLTFVPTLKNSES
jgi:Zn-dependent metalloprotease